MKTTLAVCKSKKKWVSISSRWIHNTTALLIACSLILPGCKKDLLQESSQSMNQESATQRNLRPLNIILFIADDFGYELPGYTGGSSYSTPHLDLMAANGITFSNAYSHPDGFPSRLAIYTGKYNFRNYTDWGTLPVTEKTIGNMLHDAGYATCFVGKWQQDGGDAEIHAAGYDKYRVFLPFAKDSYDEFKYEYKNPRIYENGDYLPTSTTNGKYSEDMYTDYLKSFIDSNSKKAFFAVYAHNLPRTPWAPTPDDPDFAGYNPDTLTNEYGNQKYFPGMVNYLDKKIGEIVHELEVLGQDKNTLIIFLGDNATNKKIVSIFNGKKFSGGKNFTNQKGTRAPLLIYAPTRVAGGQKDSTTLIDYTDLLPTIANIAGIPIPSTYGILDGITFFDNATGVIGGPNRPWSFCQWDNSKNDNVQPVRYIFDLNYKLYDTAYGGKGTFYNIKKDPSEAKPLVDSLLTADEINEKNNFKVLLSQMR